MNSADTNTGGEGRSRGADEAGADRPRLLQALEWEQRRASAQGVLHGQAVAGRLGINHSDLETLDLLQWAGAVTAGRLAELTGLTTGAVTRMIDRLERDGYVRREPDPADRRRVIVRLVPEALQRIGPLYEPLQRAMQGLYDHFSDAQLRVLLEFSRRASEVLQAETARLRADPAATAATPGAIAVPRASTSTAHLVFPSGAFQLTLDARPGLGDLLQARFEGPQPRLRPNGDVVVVDYRVIPAERLDLGGEIVLNGDLPWFLDIRSAASLVTADLHRLDLRGLSLRGGATQVEVTLPRPRGTVPLTIAGGASAVTLLRPAGVPLRARLRGGASDLSLDGNHFGFLGRDWRWETPDFATQPDRYDLDLSGGASGITVGVR
jgi:DNA-binding MarR family transcriptional regulator